ncbi:hypothetical protein IWX90DRAFT_189813 [Phyllosticta citrichinensis]|uniref:Uncharacterized protein n=1 Tax=Phyllosticta citrichinensis TaxID=1130410 RepID=A0ABR1XWK6_9PEZI
MDGMERSFTARVTPRGVSSAITDALRGLTIITSARSRKSRFSTPTLRVTWRLETKDLRLQKVVKVQFQQERSTPSERPVECGAAVSLYTAYRWSGKHPPMEMSKDRIVQTSFSFFEALRQKWTNHVAAWPSISMFGFTRQPSRLTAACRSGNFALFPCLLGICLTVCLGLDFQFSMLGS